MEETPLTPEERLKLCHMLGIPGLDNVHRMVVEGKRRGFHWLMAKGLSAKNLERFGYTAEGMHRLGYDKQDLRHLGYKIADEPVKQHSGPDLSHQPDLSRTSHHERGADHLRELIAAGMRATDLLNHGYSLHDCKRIGLSAVELTQLNFHLEHLVTVCSPSELRLANYGARDLRQFFSPDDLKRAGFRADEMRMAGYTVRDLMNLGYNENHIRTAGYSHNELMREGLSSTTRRLH